MKQKIINYLFPKFSEWFDIGCYENSGKYKLLQMRYNLETNKKQFRSASMGFINDYTVKLSLYEKALSICCGVS